MKRQHIRIVVEAKASPAAIYRLLKDGRSWVDWSDLDECVPEGLDAAGEEQVGTVRASRRGRTRGWDRITELVPDRRLGYVHVKGLPVVDYVASVDLVPNVDSEPTVDSVPNEAGTTIVWEASFAPRWPGTGGQLRRGVEKFLGTCAHGLADHAAKE